MMGLLFLHLALPRPHGPTGRAGVQPSARKQPLRQYSSSCSNSCSCSCGCCCPRSAALSPTFYLFIIFTVVRDAHFWHAMHDHLLTYFVVDGRGVALTSQEACALCCRIVLKTYFLAQHRTMKDIADASARHGVASLLCAAFGAAHMVCRRCSSSSSCPFFVQADLCSLGQALLLRVVSGFGHLFLQLLQFAGLAVQRILTCCCYRLPLLSLGAA